MVGSGFSRNALKADSGASQMPSWNDVAIALFRALYPGVDPNSSDEGINASPPSADNVLRLAQEFQTAFGRSGLDELLGDLLRDLEHVPGIVHERLLRLPWRDVFTTNWDSLLERSAVTVPENPYAVIQSANQLPMESQPRIIKMHGSFPSRLPLIVTEEDYRTYPDCYAPFVNTVQQAMMETVFLLIGFSGNDPNFLKWCGWVRDNLRESAPKIYLAGWLNLSPHRRLMLEHQGVVPIDLANHPKAGQWESHRRHQYAIEWLLWSLELDPLYESTMWPCPPEAISSSVPELLEPVFRAETHVPIPEPELD